MKVFNQKALDKTNTKEARKKREEAKAFGDKVMGRVRKKPKHLKFTRHHRKDDKLGLLKDLGSDLGSLFGSLHRGEMKREHSNKRIGKVKLLPKSLSVVKNLPHSKSTSYRADKLEVLGTPIPNSKVGNCKGGHGNFCGQSKIERMKGDKKGGEGLARV
tara:strand:+ start:1405 stop:1881 length:477 start_codon:yes stop_codon:yes gene_type:complete